MKQIYVYKPIKFFVIVFLITWIGLFITAYLSYQKNTELYQLVFALPSIFAPTISVIIMVAGSKNNELKKNFLNRLISLKLIRLSQIPIILLFMPAMAVLSMLVSVLFGQPISQLRFSPEVSFSAAFAPALLLIMLAPLLEEIGWRGYAIDSLSSKFNIFATTVIFSTLWALWHLPLFFVKGYYQNEIWNENPVYGVNFMVSVIVLSFILSWVYYRNNRSIIACFIFHFITNLSAELFQMEQMAKCIETVILLIVAAVIIIKNRELFFKEKHNIMYRPESTYNNISMGNVPS